MKDKGTENLAEVFVSLPSKRDKRQPSEGITGADLEPFTSQHVDDLPQIERDKGVACGERRMQQIK